MSGVVKLDDKPLSLSDSQRGMIVFRPVAGGATCSGLLNSDGTYSVATGGTAALAPGDYLVSVRVVELVEASDEATPPSGRAVTPAIYADPLTSGLTYVVKSGPNTYDVALDSTAGPATVVTPLAEVAGDESVPAEADEAELNEAELTEAPNTDEATAADEAPDSADTPVTPLVAELGDATPYGDPVTANVPDSDEDSDE